jgi:PAS domain S-box-containing protein
VPSASSEVRETNAITVQSTLRPSARHPPASIEEKALLTFRAMSSSDDIVLLLERGPDSQTHDVVVIGVNDAFRNASGYADEYILGRTVTDLFPTEDQSGTLMNALRDEGSLRSELACRKADGSTFMLGIHLMPAPARTPGRDCFVILGRDITAVLHVRQTQDSIQRLLAKVFSSVGVAVIIVSGAGRIVMTNQHVDLLLGYPPNGLVGLVTMDLVAPDARARVAAMVRQQAADGRETNASVPLLRADGSELTVRITSVVTTPGESRQFRILTLRPEVNGLAVVGSQCVGRIRLAGLEEVRAALGPRWAAATARAMLTAEAVVMQHCGPQDRYARTDETTFLLCFGKLNEADAARQVAMIAREISERLIGQGQPPHNAHVNAIATVLAFTDDDQPKDPLNAFLTTALNNGLEPIEEAARQTLREASACESCELAPVLGRDGGQVVASQVVMPVDLEQRLATAMAALPRGETREFDLDGLLLSLATRQAMTSSPGAENTLLMVTVSFDIFASRAATERFFAVCAKLDSRAANRLILLLSTLPAGLPHTRLQDCVGRLRQYCRSVGYAFNRLDNVSDIDLSGGLNPILVLPAAACAASTQEALTALFLSLQSRRASIMIREVVSERDAAAFWAAGADMVCMKRAPE